MKYWCLRRKYLFIFFCFDTCSIFFLKISKLDCFFFLIYITCALIHKRYNKNLSVVWIYVRTFSTYWLNSHASHSHATRLRTCMQWKNKNKKKKKIFEARGLWKRGALCSRTPRTPQNPALIIIIICFRCFCCCCFDEAKDRKQKQNETKRNWWWKFCFIFHINYKLTRKIRC